MSRVEKHDTQSYLQAEVMQKDNSMWVKKHWI